MSERRNAELRQQAFGLGDCPNGPDEDGTWPCDPQVAFGGGVAECQTCGRIGKFPVAETSLCSKHGPWIENEQGCPGCVSDAILGSAANALEGGKG